MPTNAADVCERDCDPPWIAELLAVKVPQRVESSIIGAVAWWRRMDAWEKRQDEEITLDDLGL